MLDYLKESIGDGVSCVRFTNKLKKHPVCLTTEGEISLEMEKVLNSMPTNEQKVKANIVLEINENHPIAQKLTELYESDKEKAGKLRFDGLKNNLSTADMAMLVLYTVGLLYIVCYADNRSRQRYGPF